MKERPILFSAPMVRALLAGTKTRTRRVVSVSNSTVNGCPAKAFWPNPLPKITALKTQVETLFGLHRDNSSAITNLAMNTPPPTPAVGGHRKEHGRHQGKYSRSRRRAHRLRLSVEVTLRTPPP